MFAPPLYIVRKYPLKVILESGLHLTGDDDTQYQIKQQDNPLFRQVRLVSHDTRKYNAYVVFVDCRGAKEDTPGFTEMLQNGFFVGQQHFVLCERSASMTRNSILSFIDDSIVDEITNRVCMGLTDVKTVLSKWYAYRGLMLSSCHCLEGWVPKIVVVPDFYKTIKSQKIKYVYDKENNFTDKDGKLRHGTQKDVKEDVRDIEINVFDGCGIHHPAITDKIQELLQSDVRPTSVLIRLPFIKGVTHEMDYVSFFAERDVTKIKDIWGQEYDITPQGEPLMIIFESMYKGLKYFKQYGDIRDWQDYWERFFRYEHCFGVAKWNFSKEQEPVYTRSNYQVLQDLNLDYEEFSHLAGYSTDWAMKIIDGDLRYAMCFLGMFADKHTPLNNYTAAILKNPEMLKEYGVRKYFISLLEKYIDDFKCGKLYLKSCFKFLVPDLVMAMEVIGDLPPQGALSSQEFYANNATGDIIGECAIERNPHICRSEHTILSGVSSPLLSKYCGHLSNVCMVNCYDIVMQRLQGADSDGDLVLIVQNDTVLNGIQRDLPIVLDVDDKITVEPELDTPENRMKIIYRSMKNLIGEYSNYASAYHNKTPKTQEQKLKYEHYIDIISVLTGKSIDFAKTGVLYLIPPYISKFGRPLPYFMRYRGDYYKRMKLSMARSNMNRLCWELEKWEKRIRWKRTYKDFDYRIMIDESISTTEDTFAQVESAFLDFCAEMVQLGKDQASLRAEGSRLEINWRYYYDQYKSRCERICGQKELANIAVTLCYEKYPNKNKKFMWVVAGDGIVSNLKQQPLWLPARCDDGDFEYLGKRYRMEAVSID